MPINRTLTPELVDRYKNPLRYMDLAAYRKRRNWYIRTGLILLIIGIAYLAFNLRWPATSCDTNEAICSRNGITSVLLSFGLPAAGIYLISRSRYLVQNEQRAELVWLNPQLKAIIPVRRPFIPTRVKNIIYFSIIGIALAVPVGSVVYTVYFCRP